VDPSAFIAAFRWPDGSEVKVRQQRDAQEFAAALLDKIKERAKAARGGGSVSGACDVFEGKLVYLTESLESKHTATREQGDTWHFIFLTRGTLSL
jgi:hypothetical protein